MRFKAVGWLSSCHDQSSFIYFCFISVFSILESASWQLGWRFFFFVILHQHFPASEGASSSIRQKKKEKENLYFYKVREVVREIGYWNRLECSLLLVRSVVAVMPGNTWRRDPCSSGHGTVEAASFLLYYTWHHHQIRDEQPSRGPLLGDNGRCYWEKRRTCRRQFIRTQRHLLIIIFSSWIILKLLDR